MINISVEQVAEKKGSDTEFVLLDVREHSELSHARLNDERVVHLPMSLLANSGMEAMPEEIRDRETEVVVFCHHGIRSIQVANWMKHMGWTNIFNMVGGINAYAKNIDSSIGEY